MARRHWLAALSSIFVGSLHAATLTVPGASATIQGAISIASPGDTILVSPGTYVESISFGGKDVIVRSTSGAAVTTIRAAGATPVVQFTGGETRNAVLKGFTITGGSPGLVAPYFGDGGGVFIIHASPTIVDNTIVGNVACRGGGVQAIAASPRIAGNVISTNRADCSQLAFFGLFWGGGVSVQSGPAAGAEVIGNTFVGNIAGSGSAVGIFSAGAIRIVGNRMSGNTSTDCRFDGGTIWMSTPADASIVQNVIVRNSGACHGGVMLQVPSGAHGPALVSNTIALNRGSVSSGIFVDGFFTNTRFVDNVVVGAPGTTAMDCGNTFAIASPAMRNNVLFSADGTAASGLCASQLGVNGNIAADPNFFDVAADNFRLVLPSAAIDRGAADPLVEADDFDGAPRIRDGDADGAAVIDIGAFEAPPAALIVSPAEVPTLGDASLATLIVLVAALARHRMRRRTARLRALD